MANEKNLRDLAAGLGFAADAIGQLAKQAQFLHTEVESFAERLERALHPGSAPDPSVAEGRQPDEEVVTYALCVCAPVPSRVDPHPCATCGGLRVGSGR